MPGRPYRELYRAGSSPVSYPSLSDLAADLAAGRVSSVELTRTALERIRAHDGRLNSFVTVTGDLALEQARRADARIAAGEVGPLIGIPIAHKDIFCTRGVRTTCGSRMLDDWIAPYDAAVVERLAAAGAVMLGKTNMDEFAMGSSSETSHHGPVRNPWDIERVPGGSSGGSAAAVAAGLATLATGTDTGGSIRQPAALCGVTGLKPTYGRVSRWGMIAFASSLDQGGLIGRSAADVAVAMGVIAGHDTRDSTSVERVVDDYTGMLDAGLSGLRIGIAREHFGEGLDARVAQTVRAAIGELERLGATLHEVSLPHTALAIPAYYVVAPAECSSNLSRFDGVRYGHRAAGARSLEEMYKQTRAEGFGAEVKRRIMIGTYALSAGYYDAYYVRAQQLRRLISADFAQAFGEVDVIAGPASPGVAFRLGEKVNDPVNMYYSDVYTCAVNLAGLPGLSVPAGFVGGLPVGLQLVGDYFHESLLLNVAHRYQQATDWHLRVPPGFS